MLHQNTSLNIKIEEDQVNYSQFYPSRPLHTSEVKIEYFENQAQNVKVQEDGFNMMIFYSREDKPRTEELTDLEDKTKQIKKPHKTKPIKTKTIIIQKISSNRQIDIKKKCKDKRTGKYEQSLAQRFIKRITGYHYCKNFNQFYQKQMSLFFKEKNPSFQSELNTNQIHDIKPKIIDSITRADFNDLNNYLLERVREYDPYMKKYKQTILFELFEGQYFNFFENFFKNLFKKVYEIMVKVTYRKCLGEFIRTNANEMEIKNLSYNGLDQIGQSEIAQAFDMVFKGCTMVMNQQMEKKRDLLRLKLQILAQMQ